MESLVVLLASVAAAGAAGGAFNSLLAGERRLWPSRVKAGPSQRITCPALAGSVLAASVAALALDGTLVASTGAHPPLALILAAAVVIGFLTSRCVTAASDNRLLRAALCKACAAPAAHRDVTRVIADAPPREAYVIACDLAAPSQLVGTRPGPSGRHPAVRD